MKKTKKKPLKNETADIVNLLLKMRQEGRMDDEEMGLILKVLFSDDVDEEFIAIVKFMYLHRPMDQSWLNEPYQKEPLKVSQRSHYYNQDIK